MRGARDRGGATLGQLTQDQLRTIATAGALEHVRADRLLLRQGDPADRWYVLVQGELRVWASTELNENADERVELRTLKPGDACGELALLEGQGGTGLGLAIVCNIVNSRLGGTVDLNSSPGEGTIVSVHIPRRVPERRP